MDGGGGRLEGIEGVKSSMRWLTEARVECGMID